MNERGERSMEEFLAQASWWEKAYDYLWHRGFHFLFLFEKRFTNRYKP